MMTIREIRLKVGQYYRERGYLPARGEIARDEAASIVCEETFLHIGDLGWDHPDRLNGFLFRLSGIDFYGAPVGAELKLSGEYRK